MDQVLSQKEIDELVSAMDNGDLVQDNIVSENDDVKAKLYDFRRPTKLSKEYVNTVHMIFEDFAKVGTNVLSTQLRTSVKMQLAAIEQISYDEFIHSIPRVTLIGLLRSTEMSGVQMIEINPQLSTIMVDLLCGGSDADIQAKDTFVNKERFTEIELALLKDVMLRLVDTFKTVWQGIVELDTKLEGLDTNPQILQTMSPNEPVILTTIEVEIGELKSFINICLPYVFFEGIIDKLSFHNWFDNSNAQSEQATDDLRLRMEDVELELETILGSVDLRLSEFLNLEVGDVVKLNRRTDEPLDAYIEGREYFKVKPGRSHGQYAIELLKKAKGAVEDDGYLITGRD